MCETPERTAGFSPSTIALEDWWFLGARALYWLLSRRQKKKKKRKTRSLPVNSLLIPLCGWLLISCTFAQLQTPSLYLCDPYANPWVMDSMNYCPPFTTSGIQKCRDLLVSQARSTEPGRKINVSRPCCSYPSSHTGWDTVKPLWAAWYILGGTACCCN